MADGALVAGRARRAVLASWCLLAVCTVFSAWRAAPWPWILAWGFALGLPLLLPLPGLLRGRRRTYAWATLCLAPLMVHGLTEVVASPDARLAAGALLFAGLAAFVALVAYLRVTRPAPSPAQVVPEP